MNIAKIREGVPYAKARSKAKSIYDGLYDPEGSREPKEMNEDYLLDPYPRVVPPGEDAGWSREEEPESIYMDDFCLGHLTSASPELVQSLLYECPILGDPVYPIEGGSLEDDLSRPPIDFEETGKHGQWEFDVCAWYQPIHYFGDDYGIFIRSRCIERVAKKIARSVDPSKLTGSIGLAARQCRAAAFLGYLFHEFYHHKVEAFGVRLHAAKSHFDLRSNQRKLPYVEYNKNVYQVLKRQGSSDLLEESLANAFAYRHFNQRTYRGLLQKEILQVTRACLLAGFKYQPPGYNMAGHYLSNVLFSEGERRLQQQVLEGRLGKSQEGWDWCHATGMMRSLQMVKETPTYIVL